jgi:hypothetical protein
MQRILIWGLLRKLVRLTKTMRWNLHLFLHFFPHELSLRKRLPPFIFGAVGVEQSLRESQGQFLSCLLEISPEVLCRDYDARV